MRIESLERKLAAIVYADVAGILSQSGTLVDPRKA